MKKFLIGLVILFTTLMPAGATKLPDNVQDFVNATFPKTVFRFDGVVVLPNNTVYLPLVPSKFNDDTPVEIKYTIPENKTLSDLPDAIVLNNDYVLLKLLKNNKGKNTVINIPEPPVELVTGLFPQDMLVPKNFVLPATMKNIIGNLDIQTSKIQGLVIPIAKPKTDAYTNNLSNTPVLKNKIMYILSNLSKNIQVVESDKNYASYALYQEDVPMNVKGYDVFLLVTSFGNKSLSVISLNDDKVIKEIEFKTQPNEIVIDKENKLAYVSSGEDASIYVVSLETMTIKKQIKLNGMCEKVILSEDGTKLFYNDKQTREVWAIELDNNYKLREVGRFANVSKIAYQNGKIYVTSRTKNYLAIVDFDTMGLMSANPIAEKPIDMLSYNNNLLVLGAGSKTIDVIDTSVDQIIKVIELPKNEFPTKIYRIDDSNIALITDAKAGIYSVIDLDKLEVIAVNKLSIPVNSIHITEPAKKIGNN